MLSNLPPGVTDFMTPGNRPEDQEWEEFCEWAIEKMRTSGLTVEELRAILENGLAFDAMLREYEADCRMQEAWDCDRAQQRESDARIAQEIDERRGEP